MYTLISLYLLTHDIFDKLRQRHSTIRTFIYLFTYSASPKKPVWQGNHNSFRQLLYYLAWDSDSRIGIISSATESKRIVCNLPFENRLFGYIHYCTKISRININLLPNTCNFHRNFQLIFSLHLSENAQNAHFREAKFQNFTGEHAPDPPSLLAPSALHTILAGLTLN